MSNAEARRRRNRRRRQRKHRLPPLRELWYTTIDDNPTQRPAAVCKRYKAYLTVGQMETHHCVERGCIRLGKVDD